MGVFKRSSAEARERSITSLRKQGRTLEQAEAEAPKLLTDLEAESIVNDILETARLPKVLGWIDHRILYLKYQVSL